MMTTWQGTSRSVVAVVGVVAGLALAACSGGESGSGSVASVTSPITGTFVDSPVNGLHYTSMPSNPAGSITANGGQYQCVPGDTVTFDLGGRVIGNPQPCGDQVTVLSVFGATSITDLRVRNLAQLLLTLSGIPADSQPIELPASIPATLPAQLNFSDPNFEQMLQVALPGRTLVSQDQVAAHLSASFTTLTVTAVNGGQITSIPAGLVCTTGTCSHDFVAGTRVTLAAVGTGFTGWSGDGCTGVGTCQILLTATQAVRAVFLAVPPPATLTINPNPGTGTGQVQCSTGGAFGPCAATYPNGTALTLRGVANSGSTFTGWSNGIGNISCTGIADCSFTVTADSSVTATFTPAITNFSVTAIAATVNGGGGTVQCSANGGTAGPCGSYPVGTALVLTATPNAVSIFTGWTGAGCTGTSTCTFTLTADTAVTANFNRPVLTVTVVGTGTVSSNPTGINSCATSCTASFNRGTSITLTATGSGFAGWFGGGCAGTGSCVLTNIQVNTSVTATFGSGGGTLTVTNAPANVGGAFVPNSVFVTRNVQLGIGILTAGEANPTHDEGLGLSFEYDTGVLATSGVSFVVGSLVGSNGWSCTGTYISPGVYLPGGTCAGITVNRVAGTVSFSNTVLTDPDGSHPPITLNGTLNFTPLTSISITSASPLAAGIVNQAFSVTLTTAGGIVPFTWSVVSGALPAGLTLNPSTGQISGTPTTQGTFTFTIRVQDSAAPQQSNQKQFSLTILPGSSGSFGVVTLTGAPASFEGSLVPSEEPLLTGSLEFRELAGQTVEETLIVSFDGTGVTGVTLTDTTSLIFWKCQPCSGVALDPTAGTVTFQNTIVQFFLAGSITLNGTLTFTPF